MPLWLKEDVEQLKAKRRVAESRLAMVRASLSDNCRSNSASLAALHAEINRLDNAIASAGSDITPNPPGAQTMRVPEAKE